MTEFNMTKFRTIRQLISSAFCLIASIIIVRIEYSDRNIFLQLLLMVLGAGVFYCVFGLSGILIEAISKKGFIKNHTVWNCVLDTFLYLALCVGSFFLMAFILKKVVWLGLIFVLGGVVEVYRDIRTLVNLADEKITNLENGNDGISTEIQ